MPETTRLPPAVTREIAFVTTSRTSAALQLLPDFQSTYDCAVPAPAKLTDADTHSGTANPPVPATATTAHVPPTITLAI